MLKQLMISLLACLPFLVACDVFVEKNSVDALKEYEKKIYVLNKDIDIEGKKLKKGDEVKIVITAGKEWIKVHAYPARANDLKADRLLILYLFDEDFEKKKFSMNYFNELLNTVVAPRGETAAPKKKK